MEETGHRIVFFSDPDLISYRDAHIDSIAFGHNYLAFFICILSFCHIIEIHFPCLLEHPCSSSAGINIYIGLRLQSDPILFFQILNIRFQDRDIGRKMSILQLLFFKKFICKVQNCISRDVKQEKQKERRHGQYGGGYIKRQILPDIPDVSSPQLHSAPPLQLQLFRRNLLFIEHTLLNPAVPDSYDLICHLRDRLIMGNDHDCSAVLAVHLLHELQDIFRGTGI